MSEPFFLRDIEIISEMPAYLSSDEDKLYITINLDGKHNYQDGGYFKVVNSDSFSKAPKMARIKLTSAEYVIHKNNAGKENWVLNSDERKKLMKLLERPVKFVLSDKTEVTVTGYEKLILVFNECSGISTAATYNRKNTKGINFDTEMPNYLNLRG